MPTWYVPGPPRMGLRLVILAVRTIIRTIIIDKNNNGADGVWGGLLVYTFVEGLQKSKWSAYASDRDLIGRTELPEKLHKTSNGPVMHRMPNEVAPLH